MSAEAWIPDHARLRAAPQLAVLAALDHQLRLVVEALAAVHKDRDDHAEQLDRARQIVRDARKLRTRIAEYSFGTRTLAAPSTLATYERRHPHRA